MYMISDLYRCDMNMSEWISVEYMKPEEGIEVLCHIGQIDIGDIPKYHIGAYRIFKNRSCFCTGPYILDSVTHWMPLPKPPRN